MSENVEKRFETDTHACTNSHAHTHTRTPAHTHTRARAQTHTLTHASAHYTDGSKSGHGVGAGIAIFIQNELAHQLRYTLHNSCSNNQAEQLAIVKALETIGKLHINDTIPRSATVHTDSRITLQSLQNTNNHNYLI